MPGYHKTLGAHVTQALWDAVQFQALREKRSASSLVSEAVLLYLDGKGVQVGSIKSLAGQMVLEEIERAGHNS